MKIVQIFFHELYEKDVFLNKFNSIVGLASRFKRFRVKIQVYHAKRYQKSS